MASNRCSRLRPVLLLVALAHGAQVQAHRSAWQPTPDAAQVDSGAGTAAQSFGFDSKGVDFGPWLRAFRKQVTRN